ncbi:MAG: mercuric transporter MerT family protein [Acetobacteraceae bacterium]
MPSNLPAGSAETAPAARGSGAVLLTAGGLAAAFAVASCCGLPFILATLGLGTAWLYDVAILAAPHRAALLAAAAICLVGGAVLLWRQRQSSASCASGGVCTKPAVRALTTVGLLAGFVLLYLGYAYA